MKINSIDKESANNTSNFTSNNKINSTVNVLENMNLAEYFLSYCYSISNFQISNWTKLLSNVGDEFSSEKFPDFDSY